MNREMGLHLRGKKIALIRFLAVGLILVSTCSCVTQEERMKGGIHAPPPRLEALMPPETEAGQGFQLQASGESAIAVRGENFMKSSTIFFEGAPLETTFGSSRELTALVPRPLYEREGAMRVTVKNGDGQVSNSLIFVVRPARSPARTPP